MQNLQSMWTANNHTSRIKTKMRFVYKNSLSILSTKLLWYPPWLRNVIIHDRRQNDSEDSTQSGPTQPLYTIRYVPYTIAMAGPHLETSKEPRASFRLTQVRNNAEVQQRFNPNAAPPVDNEYGFTPDQINFNIDRWSNKLYIQRRVLVRTHPSR